MTSNNADQNEVMHESTLNIGDTVKITKNTYKNAQFLSDSVSLRESYNTLLEVTRNPEWLYPITDINYCKKRCELVSALQELEKYIGDLVSDPNYAPKINNIKDVFIKLSSYILELILEAEWLSLSKGFTSTCLSVLKIIPSGILSKVIAEYIRTNFSGTEKLLHRQIADLHSLVVHNILPIDSDFNVLIINIRHLLRLPLNLTSRKSSEIYSSNVTTYHKYKLSAFKTFNTLIYSFDKTSDKIKDIISPDLFTHLYYTFGSILEDIESDGDTLSHAGISLIGIIYWASKYPGIDMDITSFFYKLAHFDYPINIKFDHSNTHRPFLHKNNNREQILCEDILISQLTSLPTTSWIYIIRGILKNISIYGNVFPTKKSEGRNGVQCEVIPTEEDGALDILCSSFRLFKRGIDDSIRADTNHASLQGIQLFINFISTELFSSAPFMECLLSLPDVLLSLWPSKIRYISHLSICTWKRLIDILCSLNKKCSNDKISEYINLIFAKSLNCFGDNMKLRYIALQYLLRCLGPSEILKREPLIISHLLCSLVIPDTKTSCTNLLADLITSIYDTFKTCKSIETSDIIDYAMLAFKCLIYPTIIAILHLKQIVFDDCIKNKLVPFNCNSAAEFEQRAHTLADNFRNIFGRVDKYSISELLKLSTCFTRSDCYPYISEDEKEMLQSSQCYRIPDVNHNLMEYFNYILGVICEKQHIGNFPEAENGIIHLDGPHRLSESICLYNSRMLDRVEFVDLTLENDLTLKGALIYDSTNISNFSPSKLEYYNVGNMFYISIERLRRGLVHSNDDIRLNILKTITCLPKTTKPATIIEMHLVFYACKYFVKTNVPSFRHNFISSIKPFIKRVYVIISSKAADADGFSEGNICGGTVNFEDDAVFDYAVKVPDDGYTLTLHSTYIQALIRLMISTLNPCTSDFRNTNALEILLIIYSIFCSADLRLPMHLGLFDTSIIYTLLYAMFYLSTVQQNLIYRIFMHIPSVVLRSSLLPCKSPSKEITNLNALVTRSLAGLWSVKTVQFQSGSKLLVILLNSLLNNTERKPLTNVTVPDVLKSILFGDGFKMPYNDEDVVLLTLRILLNNLSSFSSNLDCNLSIGDISNSKSPIGLLSLISQYLDSIPRSTFDNLLNRTEFENIANEVFLNIRRISEHIIKYIGKTFDYETRTDFRMDCRGHLIVNPGKHTSKHINIKSNFKLKCRLCSKCSDNLIENEREPISADPDDNKTRAFTILCWKTIHESCLSLKSLLKWLLPQTFDEKSSNKKIQIELEYSHNTSFCVDRIREIGSFLLFSLLGSRHLGCTDSFAETFSWLCKRLFLLKLYKLLNGWLNILLDILMGEPLNEFLDAKFSILLNDLHRRSEPLALAFISILKYESYKNQPILLPSVLEKLVELSTLEQLVNSSPDYTYIDARIHSLNILRAIYKCSELRSSNYVHYIPTIRVSLNNMSHDNWSVRNSAALLFASVLQHFIGNEVNCTNVESFTRLKDSICTDINLSKELNHILDRLKFTERSPDECSNTSSISKNAAVYQGSAFVLNLLTKIPIYSFANEVSDLLFSNIKYILTCNNACLRAMSAKTLLHNHFETSRGNLLSTIITTCLSICDNLTSSNYVNGSLLLLQEYLGFVIYHKLGSILESTPECIGNLFSDILLTHQTAMNDVKRLHSFLEYKNATSVFFCTLYLVCITTNCFENLIQAVQIIEMGCCTYYDRDLHKLPSLKNSDAAGRAKQLRDCYMFLSLVSSHILGFDVYKLVHSMLTTFDRSLVQIPLNNKNLTRLTKLFHRIRDDSMPKIKAIDTLFSSLYAIYLISDNNEAANTSQIVYTSFIDIISQALKRIMNKKTVTGHAILAVQKYINTECIGDNMIDSLLHLWKIVHEKVSDEHSLYNIALNLHTTIGIYLYKVNGDLSSIFDDEWFSLVQGILDNYLNNSEVLLGLFRSLHIYSLATQKNPLEVNYYDVFDLASIIIFRMIQPTSELIYRRELIRFLLDMTLPFPLSDASAPSLELKRKKYNNYCLHVYSSILILLQDDDNNVRTITSRCCSSTIQSYSGVHTQLHHNACIYHWLSLISRVFPLDEALVLFDQFTLLDKNIYRPINHEIITFCQKLLACDYNLLFTLSCVDSQIIGTKFPVLAEMDTIFHEEPSNIFIEQIIYMINIDMILCNEIKTFINESGHAIPDGNRLIIIKDFVLRTSKYLIENLKQHLLHNYQANELESLDPTIIDSISLDPIVISCCIAGFSRCCISIISMMVLGDTGECNGVWNMIDIINSITHGMSQTWCQYARTIRKEMKMVNGYDIKSQLKSLTGLEQLLGMF